MKNRGFAVLNTMLIIMFIILILIESVNFSHSSYLMRDSFKDAAILDYYCENGLTLGRDKVLDYVNINKKLPDDFKILNFSINDEELNINIKFIGEAYSFKIDSEAVIGRERKKLTEVIDKAAIINENHVLSSLLKYPALIIGDSLSIEKLNVNGDLFLEGKDIKIRDCNLEDNCYIKGYINDMENLNINGKFIGEGDVKEHSVSLKNIRSFRDIKINIDKSEKTLINGIIFYRHIGDINLKSFINENSTEDYEFIVLIAEGDVYFESIFCSNIILIVDGNIHIKGECSLINSSIFVGGLINEGGSLNISSIQNTGNLIEINKYLSSNIINYPQYGKIKVINKYVSY